MTQNCWEFNKCGKNPSSKGGGDCPTEEFVEFDGINRGKNGGRYCWRIPGTLCDRHSGRNIPNWADKMKDCIHCEFFKKVREEEENQVKI
jgi:hypothetical protein